ncbi:phosphate--nucleotide phosphotransferase [Exiguobacterium sp. Leaf187]|uniref:PPK2 family polyphosphate kinase n=1 Tax=Exiguobacterium sp. Leaf187 TaxID=1736294 RepID=UPI0006FC2B37|nr:PPK2 family polyphosphate kinase [Exiguobacterium sp. Leaf187]KQS16018.1 phosphate--nucleotide phosphotransferase [Exiguobacterium sp. Leaf187]
MKLSSYRVKEGEQVSFSNYPTSEKHEISEAELREKRIPKSVETLQELHWRLHAEEKNGVLVILQAIDAAGKDEAISYIFSNLNAQGLRTISVKKPSDTEQKHDYLWRIHEGLPEKGEVGILNRSYYEEVIAPRIHDLLEEEEKPDDGDVWQMRYRQINDFERYLVENGFRVVKFLFHVSKEEQRQRLLTRLKDPTKNFEFSFSDIEERKHWDEYHEIFAELVSATSTSYAPWYILPADDEWYSRYIVTEVMNDVLKEIDPQYPKLSEEDQEQLDEAIKLLEEEA